MAIKCPHKGKLVADQPIRPVGPAVTRVESTVVADDAQGSPVVEVIDH